MRLQFDWNLHHLGMDKSRARFACSVRPITSASETLGRILTIKEHSEIRTLYSADGSHIEAVGVTYGISTSGPTNARELIITGGEKNV